MLRVCLFGLLLLLAFALGWLAADWASRGRSEAVPEGRSLKLRRKD